MRTWMFPWAALYTAQIAAGMFIWSFLDVRGGGVTTGLLVAIPFLALAVALWRTSYFKPVEKAAETPEPQ